MKLDSNQNFIGSISANSDGSSVYLKKLYIDKITYNGSTGLIDLIGANVNVTDINDEMISAYRRAIQLQRKLQLEELTSEEHQEYNRLVLKVQPFVYRKNIDGMDWIGKMIRSGFLVGCYVNGKKILSMKESRDNSSIKLDEYQQYKEDYIDSVIETVSAQIKILKKKGV